MHKRMIRDYAAYSETPYGLIERIETPDGRTLFQSGPTGPIDLYTACSRIEDDAKARA